MIKSSKIRLPERAIDIHRQTSGDTSAFRRPIEHQPEGIEVGRSAWVLSRVGHFSAHFTAVEMIDVSVPSSKDAESWDIRVLGTDVGACVLSGRIREERQVHKAAPRFEFA